MKRTVLAGSANEQGRLCGAESASALGCFGRQRTELMWSPTEISPGRSHYSVDEDRGLWFALKAPTPFSVQLFVLRDALAVTRWGSWKLDVISFTEYPTGAKSLSCRIALQRGFGVNYWIKSILFWNICSCFWTLDRGGNNIKCNYAVLSHPCFLDLGCWYCLALLISPSAFLLLWACHFSHN